MPVLANEPLSTTSGCTVSFLRALAPKLLIGSRTTTLWLGKRFANTTDQIDLATYSGRAFNPLRRVPNRTSQHYPGRRLEKDQQLSDPPAEVPEQALGWIRPEILYGWGEGAVKFGWVALQTNAALCAL